MPQALLGMTKSRDVFAAIAGPPKPPLAFRVSAIRQGVMGANCVGEEIAGAATEPAGTDRLGSAEEAQPTFAHAASWADIEKKLSVNSVSSTLTGTTIYRIIGYSLMYQ